MEITPAQFAQVEHHLPKQRGNVSLSNLDVLNEILYVAASVEIRVGTLAAC